ncbi:MAG: glycoside hydrolase family 15 protein [Acidimicrobiia bacterium]
MVDAANDYQPIEDYGIIGDLHTVALVGKNGSIDFMSFPRFDSPTIFCGLLDRERGGRFSISPCLDGARKQLYLPDTNVLITRFLAAEGVAEVSDFMPIGIHPHDHPRILVRRVKTVRGNVSFDLHFGPRFDYARAEHTVEQRDGEVVFTSNGADGTAVRLRTAVPVTIDANGAAVARFELRAGETAAFVMEEAEPGMPSPTEAPDYVTRAFKDTVNFWRTWIGRSQYTGRWREIVNRSALVLKLLVSQTHGSLLAAATFGLPEEIGGERNWDYRYTWIRDASFTLYALIRLGYTDEAGAFMRWIYDRCMELNPDGSMQIMYGHDGRTTLTEETLPHLEGYRGSKPVRIGNGAYDQLQLDIYGELMDAVYLYNKYGEPIPHDLWVNLVRLVDWVTEHWQLPDEGVWEVRGGRQEFLYSRLMCWVAVDRGIRLADRRSLPYPHDKWRSTRDAIYDDIMTSFWNPERGCFVQHKGATTVDASNLLMPMVKFISPTDPRWLSTLRVMDKDLVDDSLVYRYRTGDAASDGLVGDEGTFNMCSFWYSEVLARSGDVQKGRFFFEKMLGYANHLGLYGEELGAHGEHLGNFPQAFTHLGLISAAYAIDRKLSDAGWAG